MSGFDEAPGGGPNQRPPAPGYPPPFNRPPRPLVRAPPGQGLLPTPPTVDPFARPQHYPPHHYHPYSRPTGRGRGSQQTGYPPQPNFPPPFNRPPRPLVRAPPGQGLLPTPPTVDPFARPQHYPTHHYHPYSRPTGRGRGSQQTGYPPRFPAPSTSTQDYSYQNPNVAGPSASYTPAQIPQPPPYYPPQIPPPAAHAEPIDEPGEQRIPVIVTHPELRPPAEPFYVNLDEGYKVKQIKGFPFSPFMQPPGQPIATVVTDRQEYQQESLISQLPQGMKQLPRRPIHSQVHIPGIIYGLMPRALRDHIDQQLTKAHELFKKIMNDQRMLYEVWNKCAGSVRNNYYDYYQCIVQQRLVLTNALDYDVLGRIIQFRDRISRQQEQHYQVTNEVIFEVRQETENMISDLEWYISASQIIMENIHYIHRLLGYSTPTPFSEDPDPRNLFPE